MAVNVDNDKTIRIKPNRTLVWANLHLSFVKTSPDKIKITGDKKAVQPSKPTRKSFQKAKTSESVDMAIIDKIPRVKATKEATAVIVFCLSLSFGNL